MHPYRPELVGSDLNDYKDPNGKLLFVESVNTLTEQAEGFIDYIWQWKDDSTRIVPKLSYVKAYEPWNGIVGTGIYLELRIKNQAYSISRHEAPGNTLRLRQLSHIEALTLKKINTDIAGLQTLLGSVYSRTD